MAQGTAEAQPYDADDWDGLLPENLGLARGAATGDEIFATINGDDT